jgi:hypothetical protein
MWYGLALVASGAGVLSAATVAEPSRTFALKCAERDVRVLAMIEDRGQAGDVAANVLADAGFARLRAQAACYQGQVGAALAIYDRVIARLDPMRLGAAQ